MNMRREDTLLHRPATPVISDDTLDGMLRDGWTPTQVRELIHSYRALAKDVADLRDETGFVGHGFVRTDKQKSQIRRHAFYTVEKELREHGVQVVEIMHWDMGASDTINMRAVGEQWTHGTLLEAIDNLIAGKVSSRGEPGGAFSRTDRDRLLDEVAEALAPSAPTLEKAFRATDTEILDHAREVVARLQSSR